MKNSRYLQTCANWLFNLYFSDYFRIITSFPEWNLWFEYEELLVLFHIWLGLFAVIFPMYAWDHICTHRHRLKVWPRFHSQEKSTDGRDWFDPLRLIFTALQFRRPKTGFRQSWDFDLRFNSYPDFSLPKFKELVSVSTKLFMETEPRIILMDTTLRDGEQTQGISFTRQKRPMWPRLFWTNQVDRIEIASARVSEGNGWSDEDDLLGRR